MSNDLSKFVTKLKRIIKRHRKQVIQLVSDTVLNGGSINSPEFNRNYRDLDINAMESILRLLKKERNE